MDFEDFLARELRPLSGYARALTGDRQLAHDVLADALLDAHRRWSKIRGMQAPGAYVRRMVTTTFLSDRRRWSTRTISTTRSGGLPDTATAGGQEQIDDRAELQQLLAGLPKQQRAAIVLRYYLDVPDDEIAAELACSAGAVRTYISRGLATLRINVQADPATITPLFGRSVGSKEAS